jgi:glycosyltransferase involved in cell wall biosynthesis
MAYPRSIQVARLLGSLDASVVVVCGAEDRSYTPYGHDLTIASGIEDRVKQIIREPFHRPKLWRYLDQLAGRYLISWSNIPDAQRGWVTRATKRFLKWQQQTRYEPDLIVTFGFPMSDHFFGLNYKRRAGAPWLAHFSDPWVNNPYRCYNRPTAWLNKRLERKIINEADGVIFTSPETLDLVMQKYPDSWREKAFYLPHCYDREVYDESVRPPESGYVLRSIGTLYGNRSPEPLLKAIERMAREKPALLEGVSVEFVGFVAGGLDVIDKYPTARRITKFVGMAAHADALRLMQTSHCLLVIDAPAQLSVFFPSKLVEYIGSKRFIFALSPEGTTARVVREAGGMIADPSDSNQVFESLSRILEQRPKELPHPTEKYEKGDVSQEFLKIARRVMEKSAKQRAFGSKEMKSQIGLDIEKRETDSVGDVNSELVKADRASM